MTLADFINLHPGWFAVYLFIGVMLIATILKNIPLAVKGGNMDGILGVVWILGWLFLFIGGVAGAIYIINAFPMYAIAIGGIAGGVLLLVLTTVGILTKSWWNMKKHKEGNDLW